jgi:hemoglobin-like flavoprotein
MHSMYFIEMLDTALGVVEAKQVKQNMKELGQLHNSFGIEEEYFRIMGQALFIMLQQSLKEDWNDEVKVAWASVYGTLSSQMVSAMKADKN